MTVFSLTFADFQFENWSVIITQNSEIVFPHMWMVFITRLILYMQSFITFVVVNSFFLDSLICVTIHVIFSTCFIRILAIVNNIVLLVELCFILSIKFCHKLLTFICNCSFHIIGWQCSNVSSFLKIVCHPVFYYITIFNLFAYHLCLKLRSFICLYNEVLDLQFYLRSSYGIQLLQLVYIWKFLTLHYILKSTNI